MSQQPPFETPVFAHAVSLIDDGDSVGLDAWLSQHPELLQETAFDDPGFAGEYFRSPKLIWFVAENPIRQGSLSPAVVKVLRVIIEAAKRESVSDFQAQLDTTLALVASGRIARESRQQKPLCHCLISAGANPDSAMRASLAHKETDIAEYVVSLGADISLFVAAGLGLEETINALEQEATDQQKQAALAVAVINGEARAATILVDNGADPNNFCPEGLHAHSTPLHQAACNGDYDTVVSLVTRGADMSVEDRIFQATPRQWAEHNGQAHLLSFFHEAEIMMPAIMAVKTGDLDTLQQWVDQHPDLVNQRLGNNPRSLLHYATDWPGHFPNSGEVVQLLISSGADPKMRYHDESDSAALTETPLHWAASSDDLDAANALIDGGADLNALGGCIGNGTPLMLAAVFKQWNVATRLLEAGAVYSLNTAATCGRLDLVEQFFNAQSQYQEIFPPLEPGVAPPTPQDMINVAFWNAARCGRLAVAKYLYAKGAQCDVLGPMGNTPLAVATDNNESELIGYLQSVGARQSL